MKPLIQPQINLNGTAREQLVDQQLDVTHALDAALKAMSDAAPHPRDYQFRLDEYSAARNAWGERMQLIHNMRSEIEAHALSIHDQE
jgi:hypothetical protein